MKQPAVEGCNRRASLQKIALQMRLSNTIGE